MESILVDYSRELQNKQMDFQKINKRIVDDWNLFVNAQNKIYIHSLYCLIPSFTNSIKQSKDHLANISFEEINIWHKAVQSDNEKHFKDGHNFNVFSLLREKFGFCIQETMHSRLIKFLLDSKETHGQGDLFLMEILKMLDIESPEKGTWSVTSEIGRIDVLIERKYPQSIIVIENKSNWASDQINQLYRYWYQAIFQKTKEYCEKFYESNTHKYQILYLVPNTNKELEQQSISKPTEYQGNIYQNLPEKIPMQITIATFDEHINNWLNNCLNALPENNHRIREYIIQYQHLCNNL